MRQLAASLLSLIAAVLVAFLVALGIGPPRRSSRPAERAAPSMLPPKPMQVPVVHAPQAELERAVPPKIEATADVLAAPWAPGIRLKETAMDGDWEERRALIEDLTTHDVRAYAIGDLLPHGSLLVGISTHTVDIMVADRELVRLRDDGSLASLEDFEVARRPPSGEPRRVADTSAEYREAAGEAIDALRSEDPEVVQAAIDALVDAGDPMAEILMRHVSSIYPVTAMTYTVPSGGDRTVTPEVQGDLVIAILERITGQTFGDPTTAAPGDRRDIVERWQRWWGG